MNLDLALILTVVALFLALVQLRDARSHARELSAQTDDLRKIKDSLSTQYLNRFPIFMPQVIEQIQGAQESIKILCDVPGYGYFTDHDRFLEYQAHLRQAVHRGDRPVSVELICLNKTQRNELHEAQFAGVRESWKKWKRGEQVDKRLRQFARVHGLGDVEALEADAFLDALAEAHTQLVQDGFKFIEEIIEIDSKLALHFWLIDGRVAVFSFPSFSEEATEHGFVTSDQRLLDAFAEMFEQYRERARRPSAPAS